VSIAASQPERAALHTHGFAAHAWLRGRAFDCALTAATLGIALACGCAASIAPRLFGPILLADLWFLGYHHVVATFTRLSFDRASFRAHHLIVLWLPIAVITVVLCIGVLWGLGSIVTLYLYWQWFHYARQSWGVAQVYRRKSGVAARAQALEQLGFYLVPLWGILNRSHQAPAQFLSMPVHVLPVPDALLSLVRAAAIASVALWFAGRARLWWQGRLPLAHTLYVATHYLIFFVAYIALDNIDVGWLTINIWHNAQYVLFVWLFNNNRFKAGVDARASFLSYLSQTRNAWLYFLVCLGLSTAIYQALSAVVNSLPVLIVTYQVINFHHYIADSVIWKTRQPALRQTLGLPA
jgi:hypothetical protein